MDHSYGRVSFADHVAHLHISQLAHQRCCIGMRERKALFGVANESAKGVLHGCFKGQVSTKRKEGVFGFAARPEKMGLFM
ncbi:hypothetical protein SDC9_89128 [bioreactor metagenome]|uniref:Uncharacterized protein n=1 Tax=bioreactor metagenome TaxID=1076179 RepID=A0A644ZV01_9ZZZZ